MTVTKYFLLSCFSAFLLSSVATAADFHVAPGGKDDQPGTADKPFATIARAQQAARKVNGERVTVHLHDGTYELDAPLTFTGEDAGTADHPVTYRAAAGQSPILSGGRRITGWQVDDAGVWHVTLDAVKNGQWAFNELFVGGERATRARFPNESYLRVEKVGEDKRTNFTYNEGDLPKLGSVEGLELVFLHDWSISRVLIASIDPASRTVKTAHNVGPSAPHYRMDHYEKHPRYFIENHAALLDAPGEWYLDTKTGRLSYKPREGQSPEKVAVVAPKLSKLITVQGAADKPVEHLHFENLTLQHCAYHFGPRYAAGQAAFHEEVESGGGLRVPTDAAITIDHARHLRLAGLSIAHVGGSGLWVHQNAHHIDILDAHVHDTGGNGLMIGQTKDESPTSHIAVTDSVVEHVGKRFYGSIGIWIGMTQHVRVKHNHVRHTPYTGISIGWRWNDSDSSAGNNTIAHNHIHHNMQILSDGGGIYTLGRQPGSKLAFNVIHDIPLNAGRAESNGMFLDQGTSNFWIAHNVIYNTDRAPLRFHQAKLNTSQNNVLVVPTDQPPYRYNRTEAEHIIKVDDRVIPAGDFDAGKYQKIIDAAGPRPTLAR